MQRRRTWRRLCQDRHHRRRRPKPRKGDAAGSQGKAGKPDAQSSKVQPLQLLAGLPAPAGQEAPATKKQRVQDTQEDAGEDADMDGSDGL